MEIIKTEVIVYSADDEEPDCNRCDNMFCSDEFCTNCGNTFWGGYARTENVEYEKEVR